MNWQDIGEQELASLSYPDKQPGVKILRQRGESRIVVEKRIPRGEQVIFLRVDKDLHRRIQRLVAGQGNVSTALVAIIEEALDKLEAGDQTWRIVGQAHEDQERGFGNQD